MKKGDIVKFKEEVDPGDDKVLMVLLEDPDGGRVLVGDLCINGDSGVKPAVMATCRYLINDLEVVTTFEERKGVEALEHIAKIAISDSDLRKAINKPVKKNGLK